MPVKIIQSARFRAITIWHRDILRDATVHQHDNVAEITLNIEQNSGKTVAEIRECFDIGR